MNNELSISIFTVEADHKPVLAFRCKTHSEAETIGFDERLRAKLSTVKSGGVPLCDALAILRVRLAHRDEREKFLEKFNSQSGKVRIVYLVDLDESQVLNGRPISNLGPASSIQSGVSDRIVDTAMSPISLNCSVDPENVRPHNHLAAK